MNNESREVPSGSRKTRPTRIASKRAVERIQKSQKEDQKLAKQLKRAYQVSTSAPAVTTSTSNPSLSIRKKKKIKPLSPITSQSGEDEVVGDEHVRRPAARATSEEASSIPCSSHKTKISAKDVTSAKLKTSLSNRDITVQPKIRLEKVDSQSASRVEPVPVSNAPRHIETWKEREYPINEYVAPAYRTLAEKGVITRTNAYPDNYYDAIIVGSGFRESLACALLAKNGQKVLQLVTGPSVLHKSECGMPLEEIMTKFGMKRDTIPFGTARDWLVDLIGKHILINGRLMDLLISLCPTSMPHFCRIHKSLVKTSLYIVDYITASRSVLLSKSKNEGSFLSDIEINFVQFLKNLDLSDVDTFRGYDLDNTTTKEFLDILTVDSANDLIFHGLAIDFNMNDSIKKTLRTMLANLASIIGNNETPLTYPINGIAEIIHTLANEAVNRYGARILINQKLLQIDTDKDVAEGISTIDKSYKCKQIYLSADLVPESCEKVGYLVLGVGFLSQNKMLDSLKSVNLVVPKSSNYPHEIYASVVGHEHGVAVRDWHQLIAWTQCTEELLDEGQEAMRKSIGFFNNIHELQIKTKPLLRHKPTEGQESGVNVFPSMPCTSVLDACLDDFMSVIGRANPDCVPVWTETWKNIKRSRTLADIISSHERPSTPQVTVKDGDTDRNSGKIDTANATVSNRDTGTTDTESKSIVSLATEDIEKGTLFTDNDSVEKIDSVSEENSLVSVEEEESEEATSIVDVASSSEEEVGDTINDILSVKEREPGTSEKDILGIKESVLKEAKDFVVKDREQENLEMSTPINVQGTLEGFKSLPVVDDREKERDPVDNIEESEQQGTSDMDVFVQSDIEEGEIVDSEQVSPLHVENAKPIVVTTSDRGRQEGNQSLQDKTLGVGNSKEDLAITQDKHDVVIEEGEIASSSRRFYLRKIGKLQELAIFTVCFEDGDGDIKYVTDTGFNEDNRILEFKPLDEYKISLSETDAKEDAEGNVATFSKVEASVEKDWKGIRKLVCDNDDW